MLITIDLHEDLIDVERIAVAPVVSFQTAGIFRTKLDTPEPDAFIANCDSPLG